MQGLPADDTDEVSQESRRRGTHTNEWRAQKGSRRLTLHRVGKEADPVQVSRSERRPGGPDLRLATRTRGTGGGGPGRPGVEPAPSGAAVIFSVGRVSARKSHLSTTPLPVNKA